MKNLTLAPLLVLVALLVTATPTLAATGHGLTATFGSEAGQLKEPAGVAVSEVGATKGDVYVVDKGNNRVDQFSSTGAFIATWGWGVGNGEAKYETCTSKCQTGLAGVGAAQFDLSEAIAVDNSSGPSAGDVYVTSAVVVASVLGQLKAGADVVDKFSASGAYLGQIAGTCANTGEVPPCSEPSKFTALGEVEGIGVDSSGELWVANRTNGENEETFDYSDGQPNQFLNGRDAQIEPSLVSILDPGFAVDSEDNLYVVYGGSVVKLDSTGAVLEPALGGWTRVQALAVDLSDNDVYLGGEPPNGDGKFWDVGEFAANGSLLETFGETPGVGPGGPAAGGIGVDAATNTVYVAKGDAVEVYTDGAKPQAPHTAAPGEITATSAELVGTLEPSGAEQEYYFEYYEAKVAACNGTGTKTAASKGTGSVSLLVEGLQPSAEHTYCLVAKNTFGAEPGSAETFPTPGAKPEIVSESASSVERAEGEFAAEINPNNQETTYTFEYSTEKIKVEQEEGTKVSGTLPAGFGAQREKVEVEEEEVADTYYYRVVATNATGTTEGKIEAYTKVPHITGESTSGLTLTEVTLEALIKSDHQTTEYHFEYATGENAKKLVEEGKGIPVIPSENLLSAHNSEDPAQRASAVVSGLLSNTIYYYRVIAENESTRNLSNADEAKPVVGEVEKFTTLSLPFVSTGEAQNITRTTATLSGTVTQRFVNATYYFAYISEAGYQAALKNGAANPAEADYQTRLAEGAPSPYAEGETTTPVALAPSESPQAVGPIPVSGLRPGVTYHYALVASNVFGKTVGNDRTLTALSGTPPIVSTGGVSGVSQNGATLSGTVGTNSLQTNYGFEIGTELEHYGPATGLGSLGGTATQGVSVTLGELQPGTTYYYRVTATNADGTESGQPESFTTPGFPTLIAPPASPAQFAFTKVAFPSETNTQSPSIAVVSHKVKGKTATLEVSVPSAGKLVATGRNVSKGTGKSTKAEDVTVKVTLTKAEQARLAKHRGRKLLVKVSLTFTPTKGAELTASATVLIG